MGRIEAPWLTASTDPPLCGGEFNRAGGTLMQRHPIPYDGGPTACATALSIACATAMAPHGMSQLNILCLSHHGLLTARLSPQPQQEIGVGYFG